MLEYYTPQNYVQIWSERKTQPFYQLASIKLNSRCWCNGHASVCSRDGGCECEHNTAGLFCDECLPLFNEEPWRRGVDAVTPNPCIACDGDESGPCSGQAGACVYDPQLERGVCVNCQNLTAGPACETCSAGTTRALPLPAEGPAPCVPCSCDLAGTVPSSSCDPDTGACVCSPHVTGKSCNRCETGWYGLGGLLPTECTECDCDPLGVVQTVCDSSTGACHCAPGYTGERCDKCESGWFQHENGCAKCDPVCVECSRDGVTVASPGAACSKCSRYQERGPDSTSALRGPICVENCSANSYPDGDGICTPCHFQCIKGCSGSTDEDCEECRGVRLNGKCVDECPADMWADSDRECAACDPECYPGKGCSGLGPTRCNMCRLYEQEGTCVNLCPVGSFADNAGICQKCSGFCDQSKSCAGSSPRQCDACLEFAMVVDGSTQVECVDACPAGHFKAVKDISGIPTKVCSACDLECDGCHAAGPDNCARCKNKQLDGVCVPQCPYSAYEVENVCLRCNEACDATEGCTGPGPASCKKCRLDHVGAAGPAPDEGVCSSDCPKGFYASLDLQTCRQCAPECEICFGDGLTKCTLCTSPYVRFGTTCVTECPVELSFPRVTAGGEQICGRCDPSCGNNGCVREGPANCKACSFAFDVMGEECVESCPEGQYRSHNSTAAGSGSMPPRCIPCHPACVGGCTGAGPGHCAGCRALVYESTCVDECTASQYQRDGKCFDCDDECIPGRGCSGPGASKCTECRGLQVLFPNKRCVATCPDGTFEGSNGYCIPCSEQCAGRCTGPTSSDCLGCKSVQLGSKCVEKCPSGWYGGVGGLLTAGSGLLCRPCDLACTAECTGPGPAACVAPVDGTGCKEYRAGDFCVDSCDAHSYAYDGPTGKRCFSCDPECAQGCTHDGPAACVGGCRNLNMLASGAASSTEICIAECPNDRYPDLETGQCHPCLPICTGAVGGNPNGFSDSFCFGPTDRDCRSCDGVTTTDGRCAVSCGVEGYKLPDVPVCAFCHPQCGRGCSGPGPEGCLTCKNWRLDPDDGGGCVAECSADAHFADTVNGRTCRKCHASCDISSGSGGCPTGTGPNDCARCSAYRRDRQCVDSCSDAEYTDQTDTFEAVYGICRSCDKRCGEKGCFGPGPDKCLDCAEYSFQYDDQCVLECPDHTFRSGKTCQPCDTNCLLGCSAAGPSACRSEGIDATELPRASSGFWGCAAVADCISDCDEPSTVVAACRAACPTGRFRNQDNFCQSCSRTCNPQLGCFGPGDSPGPDGCKPCPAGHFLDEGRGCSPCHPLCKAGCDGPTSVSCAACQGVRGPDKFCHASCDSKFALTHYLDDYTNPVEDTCEPCHALCIDGCTGSGPAACVRCRHFKDLRTGVCTASCEDGFSRVESDGSVTCAPCADECAVGSGCTGPLPADCLACQHVRALASSDCTTGCGENEVVKQLHDAKHCVCDGEAIERNGTCVRCSDQCAPGSSCTGAVDNWLACHVLCVIELSCTAVGSANC